MNLLKSILSNALQNITRNKLISILSFGVIAFTLSIYGIFNYITYSLDEFTGQFSRHIEAIFYLRDNPRQADVDTLIKKLEDNLLVDSVAYKSQNQAEVGFTRQFPELEYILSEFEKSPFPSSLEVKFKQTGELNVKILSLIEEIERLNLVESKQVNLDWAKKVLSIKKFISAVGIFLSLILIFVSCFIIFNVIKLNIFYRREEIAIFRVVGAQDWYIRLPFVIEGALLGLLGSVVACIILFTILKFFPVYAAFMFDIVKGMIDFKDIPVHIFSNIVFVGTVIGLLSSYLSLRQFLKD